MIFWLDNDENHKRDTQRDWEASFWSCSPLAVGNYTEKDVFECARAFTGWTIGGKLPRYPYGRYPWPFEFSCRGPRLLREDLPRTHRAARR